MTPHIVLDNDQTWFLEGNIPVMVSGKTLEVDGRNATFDRQKNHFTDESVILESLNANALVNIIADEDGFLLDNRSPKSGLNEYILDDVTNVVYWFNADRKVRSVLK